MPKSIRTRYFKATDGKITGFRASHRQYVIANLTGFVAWSSSTAMRPGWVPATEIDKAEYNRLVALKAQRIAALAAARAAEGEAVSRGFGSGPQDSWIENAALAEPAPGDLAQAALSELA